MKKFLALTMAALMLAPTAAFADTAINVNVNNNAIDFTGDQPPVIVDGRTLVPLRAVFEAIGAEVEWFEDSKRCEISYEGVTAGIQIGSTEVVLGEGASVLSDVPAQIINGRTMIPLRIISESIGAKVEWDGDTKTVSVTTPEIKGEAPISVEYETKTASITDAEKNLTINYEYPVVTSTFTMADKLNKTIVDDVTSAAAVTLADYDGELTEINIKFDITMNEGGIFAAAYQAEGELWYMGVYGISAGAKIDNEAFYAMMSIPD